MINLIFERAGQAITLPANPENIEINIPGNNEKTEVIGLGEIVIPKTPGLATFSISSLFPADEGPLIYTTFIDSWRNSNSPARFTASGLGISMQVVIEDFSYDRRAGEVGDFYYDLSLSEYRPYGAKIVTPVTLGVVTVATPVAETRIDNTPPVAQTYTAVSGDNLWSIAARLGGQNGENWRELYEANKEVIGNNPSLIYAGQVFTIPAGWVTA